MHILNLNDSTGWTTSNHGESYRWSEKNISDVFGAKNLGFHLEIMAPKTFSCPYHFHTKEEEMMIVIEGEAIVRKNGQFRKVKSGDLVYYETGEQSAHNLYNHTDKPFKYFVLSTKSPDEICYYPDSKKMLSRLDRKITQNGAVVDYFKDEEDPGKYWPPEVLAGNVD
jgi:uncharacterized cupin superfamily protein